MRSRKPVKIKETQEVNLLKAVEAVLNHMHLIPQDELTALAFKAENELLERDLEEGFSTYSDDFDHDYKSL